MSVREAVLALGVVGISLVAHAQDIYSRVVLFAQDIQFTGPGPAQTTVLYGDITKPGLYVDRMKLAQGWKGPPHRHPEERTVLILSGTLYYGLGEQWDESKFTAYPPGTFFSEPPNSPHFGWAKDGEVILQVTGIGPTGTIPVQ